MLDTIYEVHTQKSSVHLNLPFGNSAFAVAHAAKQGIVSMLKAIKEMSAGMVMPVAPIMATTSVMPSSVAIYEPATAAASVPNVAMTFSFATKPVRAATANTQPFAPSCEPNPSGVNSG